MRIFYAVWAVVVLGLLVAILWVVATGGRSTCTVVPSDRSVILCQRGSSQAIR